MSKLDAVRAMREALYAEAQSRAGSAARTTPTTPPKARQKPTPAAAKAVAEPAPGPTAADDDLCGHRNISGRTCTRERGHSARSHRYG